MGGAWWCVIPPAICVAAVQQGTGFCGPEADQDANACLFAVKKALELSYEKVTVQRDYLSIIAKP